MILYVDGEPVKTNLTMKQFCELNCISNRGVKYEEGAGKIHRWPYTSLDIRENKEAGGGQRQANGLGD